MSDDNGQDEPSNLWSKPPNRKRTVIYVIVVLTIIFALIEIAAYLASLSEMR